MQLARLPASWHELWFWRRSWSISRARSRWSSKKKMKRAAFGVAGLTVILLVTVFVSRLKPAAPSVDKATLWPDVVKRGPMVRQVRGTGTLVPEDTRWIPATTAGRVERILLRSGADVEPDSRHRRAGQPRARTVGRRSPPAARIGPGPAHQPPRRAGQQAPDPARGGRQHGIRGAAGASCRPRPTRRCSRKACRARIVAKKNRARADDLQNRTKIEQQRLELAERTLKSQLAVQEAEVSRLRTTYQLRQAAARQAEGPGRHQGQAAGRPGRSRLAGRRRHQRRPRRRPEPPQGRTAHPGNPDPRHRDRPDRLDRHAQRLRRRHASHASTPRPPTEP